MTIEYEQLPEKPIEKIVDNDTIELRNNSIKKLEQKQSDNKIKAEAGIIEIPKVAEQIPKELPKYLFKVGANAINCQKFNLDDEESKLMSKHISILTGNVNSKIFSLLIIIIVIVSKVTTCWEMINSKFSKKHKEENKEETKEKGIPMEA